MNWAFTHFLLTFLGVTYRAPILIWQMCCSSQTPHMTLSSTFIRSHMEEVKTRRWLWSQFLSYQRSNESQFRDVHHKKCNNHRITLYLSVAVTTISLKRQRQQKLCMNLSIRVRTLWKMIMNELEFYKLCSGTFWTNLSHNYCPMFS